MTSQSVYTGYSPARLHAMQRRIVAAVVIVLALIGASAARAGPLEDAFEKVGNVVRQNNLGIMYFNGDGVPQDYVEAVKWYRLRRRGS